MHYSPGRDSRTRDSVLRRYLALVYNHLGELPRGVVPVERVCRYCRDVDIAPEVAGEVAEVRPLFNDGSCTVTHILVSQTLNLSAHDT